jgi:death-on-curing protein
MEWNWVSLEAVLAIHEEQLAIHGGRAGFNDVGTVEANTNAPRWIVHFAEPDNPPDVADLAAAYIAHMATNQGVVDGSKRTAWVTGRTFVEQNGFWLELMSLT